MPTYQYEAMDSTGQEIRDVIEAASPEEAQSTIRQKGYFVTKIAERRSRRQKKSAEGDGGKKKKKGRQLVWGGVSAKLLAQFTRQLSILQDAGLPILRSLRILEAQAKPGRLKYSLLDVCEEIEAGSTLSEAMSKSPKAFDRLYVNMIRAGEAGGALEAILGRLAEFQEKAEALKRKVKGALIYPTVIILVASAILVFIMGWIVPAFQDIFDDFDIELPTPTLILMAAADVVKNLWFLIFVVPISLWLFVKLMRRLEAGRRGWDTFIIKIPIFGPLIEKNIMARSTRTLGTLISSGVPILEALNITKETSGNAVFEKIFGRVIDSIREGESIAKPLKEYSRLTFEPMAAVFWFIFVGGPIGVFLYLGKSQQRVVDDLVVNMVDVGEETGELDAMLYKVADTYDDEVAVLTEGLVALMEPLLIVGLGLTIGGIVISLFMPMIQILQTLQNQ
ncbi:MAG: type II secretion system F family protein [Planctomycetota bacterium]|nr:MAG: type II secretion system F family protein [Planctomycetota bacterium]REJ96701.1 MAG: type II secretion system F family protein [Planctomycetota bacterium]REK22302.1 MAG: type II secretion system F family protein [Planctomycetota bacterium]REK41069.1 MAG: type II secretion system F family protein [Planctomycetota bacterium]